MNSPYAFTNPMSGRSTADPYVMHSGNFYYCMYTMGDRIRLHRSRRLAAVLTDECKDIYFAGKEVNGNLWAPEMYFSGARWYVYSSGTTRGNDFDSIRMICLESEDADPFGDYRFKAYTDPDIYAIDQTLWREPQSGELYFAYAHIVPGFGNVVEIARAENPWTVGRERAVICKAELEWEKKMGLVTEGPFFLPYQNRFFILYSANDTNSPDYCLGLLEYTGGDMIRPEAWKKHPVPIFKSGAGVCSVGHCSVFRSPDGTQYWLAYHGRLSKDYSARRMFCQPFGFDNTGFPVFGEPSAGIVMQPPAGE